MSSPSKLLTLQPISIYILLIMLKWHCFPKIWSSNFIWSSNNIQYNWTNCLSFLKYSYLSAGLQVGILFLALLHTSWLLHHYILNKYGLLSSASKYWIGMSSLYRCCLNHRSTLLRSRKKVRTEYRGAQICVLSKFNIQKFLEWNNLSFSTMMLAVWIRKYSHSSLWLLLSHFRYITNLIYSSIVSGLY